MPWSAGRGASPAHHRFPGCPRCSRVGVLLSLSTSCAPPGTASARRHPGGGESLVTLLVSRLAESQLTCASVREARRVLQPVRHHTADLASRVSRTATSRKRHRDGPGAAVGPPTALA
jgi:hypothetical protein